MRHEDLEDTLKRDPMWEPPAGFANRVVARSKISGYPRPPAAQRLAFDFFRAGQLAFVSAALIYIGTWILWRVMPLVTVALVENAIPVAWTSAALSLACALWCARDQPSLNLFSRI